jgi:hypothetical protein
MSEFPTPEQYQTDQINNVLAALGVRAELRVLQSAVAELSTRVGAPHIPALADPAVYQAETMRELRKLLEGVGERNPNLARAVFAAAKRAGAPIPDPDGTFS